MIYVDFDGVIMDTYHAIFDDYIKETPDGIHISSIEHVKNKDWNQALKISPEINNSLKYLRELKNEVTILTKIHSMENEGAAKIKFLRENGVECNIILTPYMFKKTDMVSAKGNILIDDAIFNLDDFTSAGGKGIYFNKNNEDIDDWNCINTRYPKIRSLSIIKKIK